MRPSSGQNPRPGGARHRHPHPLRSRRGEHLYNFWRDADNPRGPWRHHTAQLPQRETDWEILIDVDALAHAGRELGVGQRDVLDPDHTLALISLSAAVPTRRWSAIRHADGNIRTRWLRAAGGEVQ